ncbi:uncharacterized protein RAG0_08484 [Rhynchosporium agropyri]|uniref:Uncharacterized protein n=1 Tax=Rhynchosporium agropyri TaxID=914238 RepID=A0A1E1KR12_9HELO|nr:uncharacterized protein RAG0_08484 [Rhynchosporium agropyri]
MIVDNEGLFPLAVHERAPAEIRNSEAWPSSDTLPSWVNHMDKFEVSYQVGVTGVAVDTIALIITNLLVPDDGTKHPGRLIASTLREWMAIARRHHEKLEGGLSESEFKEMFYRVIVNDPVRNGELWPIRQPGDNDLSDIEGFVETGEWDVNGEDIWNPYVYNQTFFVTKSGMMGMGHL